MNRPTKIITHTAQSSKIATAQDVDAWHKERWPGFTSAVFKNLRGEPYHVGYHYVIEWGGKVVQTRALTEEGAHCIGQNNSSIGICFMGNGDHHYPSLDQINAWRTLYAQIKQTYPSITTNDIFPHRKYANKTCHGALLGDTHYADLIAEPDPHAPLKAKIRELQALLNRLLAERAQKRMSRRELTKST